MNIHSADFYHAAIKNAFPNSWELRTPDVPGGVCPLFLCDTPQGTKVCRFSDSDMIYRNKTASDVLLSYNIPVPETQTHAYFDTRFESYDYCPAPTLYECIQSGMSDRAVFKIFKSAINIQKQISQIPISEFKPRSHRYASDVFITAQKMRLHPVLANAYGIVYRLCSDCGQMQLLHNDLYEKNILVNNDGGIARLIDLDSVSLCNESFSVLLTLRTYPLDNYSEYMDYYEDTMGRTINRRAIMHGLGILHKIRKTQLKLNQKMWRGYNQMTQR